MSAKNLCYSCFCEKPGPDVKCPSCGHINAPNTASPNCLKPGTQLNNGRYIVGTALGVGGFGITYKCLDTQIGVVCAIKEYFPVTFALRTPGTTSVSVPEQNIEKYKKIMTRFVDEAKLVKSFKHPNIITIHDSFFENNTAYYVMEYCDGIDLRKYTNNFTKKLSYDEGMNILFQVMNGLEHIHSRGILHRDIAPDNIYITKNSTVKILDFGSARNEMDQYNRELSVIIKVGYAPIEQYGGKEKQGPYTDIYALGATFYHLFTSRIPIESTQRVAGEQLVSISALRPDLPENLRYCIEKSMEIFRGNRIANIAEMKRILGLNNESLQKNRENANQSAKKPKKAKLPPPPPAIPANNGIQAHSAVQNQPVSRHPSGYPPVNQSGQIYGNPPRNGSQHPPGYVSGQPISGRGVNPGYNPLPPQNGRYKPADMGIRIFAYCIDILIWLSFYMVFAVVYNFNFIITALVFPLLFTGMNIVLELISGATLGKLLFGLRVCGRTTFIAPAGHIFLRNLIKLSGIFALIFGSNDRFLEDIATNSVVYAKC